MTSRQMYEALLIELNKTDAPNILLEDFNYFANKAINQYINKRYNIYDVNQQTTDDLRVLKATAVLPVNKVKDLYLGLSTASLATYETTLPSDYLHILNVICIYRLQKTFKCYNAGQFWRAAAKRLTADAYSLVLDNFWNKPTYKRPYYYIHNVNKDILIPTNPYDGEYGTDISIASTDTSVTPVGRFPKKINGKTTNYTMHKILDKVVFDGEAIDRGIFSQLSINNNKSIEFSNYGIRAEIKYSSSNTIKILNGAIGANYDDIIITNVLKDGKIYLLHCSSNTDDYDGYATWRIDKAISEYGPNIIYYTTIDHNGQDTYYFYYVTYDALNGNYYYNLNLVGEGTNRYYEIGELFGITRPGSPTDPTGVDDEDDESSSSGSLDTEDTLNTEDAWVDKWGNPIIDTKEVKLFSSISLHDDKNHPVEVSNVERSSHIRYGNASQVRMEIRYGSDDSVFKLQRVLVDYIKAPQNIRLTQEQLDLTEDSSQMLEYPDYVCQEIINELVHIVMENIGDPKLQTHPIVSLSIANPAQQLTEPVALPATT